MDRIIKFRGKRIDNGEWVYGDLVRAWVQTLSDNGRLVTQIRKQISDIYGVIWNETDDAIPETVGQYTGLKDKNGTELYDSDLLTDMVGDVFEVFYNTAHCAYMAKYVRTKHAEKKRGYFRLGDQCSLTIEVIGNVWENPELLK